MGRVGAWVAWVGNLRGSHGWKICVSLYFGVSQKNGMGGVGSAGSWNLGVGLRCFIEKALLKISQDLQENICAGVST